MGFLDKLWDETVAGPAPEKGLGKLRKYNSFSAAAARRPPPIEVPGDVAISRSITLLRTQSNFRHLSGPDSGPDPSSPADSGTPTSPYSPVTPRGDFKKLARRRSTMESSEPTRSPTVHDWIVINALDR